MIARSPFRGGAALWAAALLACSSAPDEAELRRILDSDRHAHVSVDANRLVAHVADTLLLLDGGNVIPQTRDEIAEHFRSYFAGAVYAEWRDLEDPVIRIADDGSMAWVARRVRVDRTGPRFGGGTTRERFVSSWVATYEPAGDTWMMTSVTSTFTRTPSPLQILEAAWRAVGGADAVRGTGYIRFAADASGPSGDFRVTVHATAAGAARIEFSTGFAAGITRPASWSRQGGALTDGMSDTLETFVRGHDLMYNALRPDARYVPLTYGGTEPFDGIPAIRIDGLDALGGPIALYFARQDTVPLGYRVVDQLRGGAPVTTRLLDWRMQDGIRLPTRARFVQGDDVFVYDIVEIETGARVDADVFLPND